MSNCSFADSKKFSSCGHLLALSTYILMFQDIILRLDLSILLSECKLVIDNVEDYSCGFIGKGLWDGCMG